MASRLIYSLTILLFIFLLNNLCFHQATSNIDSVKNETKSERLVNSSIPAPKNTKMNKIISKVKKFLFPSTYASNASAEIVDPNIKIFSQHTGYISIRRSRGARLFYYFFESRGNKTDPVVLWLTGDTDDYNGRAAFYPNSPFQINDDLSLRWNDYGLDKVCNILYIDQPTGIGFSYSSHRRDIRKNSKEVSEDLYDFLEVFFQARPIFLKNDFYIVGSGSNVHVAPLLASLVNQKNKAKEGVHINLKGLAITNGDTAPEYTQSALPDFIYANKLISRLTYDSLKEENKKCLTLIQRCQTDDNICNDAFRQKDDIFFDMRNKMGIPDLYDFRKYNNRRQFTMQFQNIKNLLALNHVTRALGIKKRTYLTYNDKVTNAMKGDSMKSSAGIIPLLLEDEIKVLIFDGECDLVCNWLGNFRWMEAMIWSGRSQYLKTKLTSYKVDGKKVGNIKNFGPLTFLKVFDAGHEVAKDQPYVSLQIFKNWLNS